MEQSAAMLFALEGSRDYGARGAVRFDWPPSPDEKRAFENGEHNIWPLIDLFFIRAAGFVRIAGGLKIMRAALAANSNLVRL